MDFPQLIWLILIVAAVWYGLRRLNALPSDPSTSSGRRRSGPQTRSGRRPPPRIEAEDLVACRVCGTYMAAGAPGCGRRDCPHSPRSH